MDYYTGSVVLFAGNFAPENWVLCDGRQLEIEEHESLYLIFKERYGGDGKKTFAIPDLRGTAPVNNLIYIICVKGYYPSRPGE